MTCPRIFNKNNTMGTANSAGTAHHPGAPGLSLRSKKDNNTMAKSLKSKKDNNTMAKS
jgi:hypothetical protein